MNKIKHFEIPIQLPHGPPRRFEDARLDVSQGPVDGVALPGAYPAGPLFQRPPDFERRD